MMVSARVNASLGAYFYDFPFENEGGGCPRCTGSIDRLRVWDNWVQKI